MAVSIRLSNTRLWLLMGALGAIGAHQMACSSTEFRSCNETRTCAPEPEASGGSAGDESPGAGDDGGQASAGVAGTDDGDTGGAPEEGGGGGLAGAGAGVAEGGSNAGDGGQAGSGGEGGSADALGSCKIIPQSGVATLSVLSTVTEPPALANGTIQSGTYDLHAFVVSDPSLAGQYYTMTLGIEVRGNTAALEFPDQTLLIKMGTPSSLPPTSVVESCDHVSVPPATSVGTDLTGTYSYEVSGGFFRLLEREQTDWTLLTFDRRAN